MADWGSPSFVKTKYCDEDDLFMETEVNKYEDNLANEPGIKSEQEDDTFTKTEIKFEEIDATDFGIKSENSYSFDPEAILDAYKIKCEELVNEESSLSDQDVKPKHPAFISTVSSDVKTNTQTQIYSNEKQHSNMFTCSESKCTKLVRGCNIHQWRHKDPNVLEMLKCNDCAILHKKPEDTKMFRCSECEYKTKHNSSLKTHMLLHKDPKYIEMFRCNECEYTTKLKSNLKQHMLVHKDPKYIEMFQCNECEYKAKEKGNLKRHMLVH